MTDTSTNIIILNSALLVFLLIALRIFPYLKKALSGAFFILMPVGMGLFMDPSPKLTMGIVVAGLCWVLYFANAEVARNKNPVSSSSVE